MITSWRLANFKSIRERIDLPLKPLTILAGANSSGKSTFIQSLLLVAQTLATRVGQHDVVLNGQFVKLGQFDELKSSGGDADDISIGWTVCPGDDGRRFVLGRYRDSTGMMRRGRREEVIQSVSCDFSFRDGAADISKIYPIMSHCTLETRMNRESGESGSRIDVMLQAETEDDLAARLALGGINPEIRPRLVDALRFSVQLDEGGQSELEDLAETAGYRAESVGCVMRHFLPAGLAVRIESVERRVAETEAALMGLLGLGPPHIRTRYVTPELLKRLTPTLGTEVIESLSDVAESRRPLSSLELRERRNRAAHVELRFSDYEEKRTQIRQAILDSLSVEDVSGYELDSWELPSISGGTEFIHNVFSNSVRYLGPLRDEPRPIYPSAPAPDPMDVGLRGENTAAVLELHKNQPIVYIPSSSFSSGDLRFDPQEALLDAAVTDWLKYLGVGIEVSTKDRGRLGHSLTVRTSKDDAQSHDLTHVGVGLSQVLPILVAGLLARPQAVLVLEQPELHLHPAVQSRLGDFFLSMAMLGQQCIIETHSEHLVNHLRLRSAAAEGDQVSSRVAVYFVKQREGSSEFTEVVMNEYGAILDWPEGFFDQAELASEEILKAAMLKRKRHQEGGAHA